MKTFITCMGASFSIVIGAFIAGADFDLSRWQIWVFLVFVVFGLALAWAIGYFDKSKTKENKLIK